MKEDIAIDSILKRLSGEFRQLSKTLSKPRFVLDISAKNLKEMGVENIAKAQRDLRKFGDTEDLISNRYVVYNDRKSLYAALGALSTDDTSTVSGLSVDFDETSARSDNIIADVVKKSEKLFKYSTPDLRVKIARKISDKVFEASTTILASTAINIKYDKRFSKVIQDSIRKSIDRLADKDYILESVSKVLISAADNKSLQAANISKTITKKGKPKVGKITKVMPLRNVSGIFTSATNLQFLLQSQLEQAVEDNMGKPSDPAIRLRYQTGRFARSVKVTSIRNTNREVYINYTYQRYPYDTFLPGGRLNPPLERDPRLIIGSAIRDIAIKYIHRNFIIHTRLEGYNEF